MTKSTKNTLKSMFVMAVISIVAVTLLSLANAFFPKYEAKLDKKTAGLISQLLDLGLSDSEAYSGGYIEMEEIDSEELKTFNTQNGVNESNSVLAVYTILKGEKTGYRVVESQAQGYGSNPVIMILTSFDKDCKIESVIVKQQKENPTGEKNIFTEPYFDRFLAYVKGKTAVSSGDILSATGATNSFSINGLTNAVGIAAAYVAEKYSDAPPPPPPPAYEAVTSKALLQKLKTVSDSESFTAYVAPSDRKNSVYKIYVGNLGDILVAGRSNGYGGGVMGLLVKQDAQGAVDKVVIIEENEYLEGIEGTPGKDFDLSSENLTAILHGMTLETLKATDNVLTGTTGATLQATAPAVKTAVINALEYYPLAAEYIDSVKGE